MFYLHVSNRTENLLRHLVEIIRVDRQPSVFATELFLIQSQGMERMIVQHLARHFRCFCNYKFFLPLDFLGFVADSLGLGIRPDGFTRQLLTWRLDELLRNISGDPYWPLITYLQGDNVAAKRFQLARRLANIFDQYQVMRPDMVLGWERGLAATGHPTEKWQMELWRRLLAQPGGQIHRTVQLTRIIDRLTGGDEPREMLPKRISVIGLHTFPPIYLEFLNSLARHMDVHLFLLSPCRNYWGNIASRKTQLKERVRRGEPLHQQMDSVQHHPLLASLGGQGRDLQNMMLDSAHFELELASYADPLEGHDYAAATLLHRLQADLLEDTMPSVLDQSAAAIADDSIQVVSCHSQWRELTVLKDHLLHLLHRDHDLQLRDIVVMAPDIQEYAPLIPAIFNDIQHSIADRSLQRRNAVIGALLSFFELLTGRFGWSELFDLLRRPVVFPQFQITLADLDLLRQWITGSGIRWGLDAGRGDGQAPGASGETSWRAGLERLLMGYAIDSDAFVDNILPFRDIEGKGALALGGLCQFIDLVEKSWEEFQQSRPLEIWAADLRQLARQLFGEADDPELMELYNLLDGLPDPDSGFHTSRVEFTVIREWIRQSARESRSSSGFLRGQLTFCSMLPMRSIPFKVVCLIGLCDGLFPKADRHDTFDLLRTGFRVGDRSLRADDRYLFLEVILAARSHLYLSYIGQSRKTNESQPPSVVVSEFLELLDSGYGVKDIVVRHPLHPFSHRYFVSDGTPELFSYDRYYWQTALAIQQKRQPAASWWQGQLEERANEVQLNDLLRFYANPQRYFIRSCLGLHLEPGDDLPDDRESFTVTGLDKYLIDQELVRLHLAGKTGDFCRKMQHQGLWPLGTPGRLAFAEKMQVVEDFADRVLAQPMGDRLDDEPFELTIGDYRLVGTLANLYEEGAMLFRLGKLHGADLLRCWIHHLLLMHLRRPGQTRLITEDGLLSFIAASPAPTIPVEPTLERLLCCFVAGCRAPSPLYVEPAFVYVRQLASPLSRISPIDKARNAYTASLDKGYQPEWALLQGNQDVETILGESFTAMCHQIMHPIWRAAGGS